jgi:hypothetical protein
VQQPNLKPNGADSTALAKAAPAAAVLPAVAKAVQPAVQQQLPKLGEILTRFRKGKIQRYRTVPVCTGIRVGSGGGGRVDADIPLGRG